MAALPPGVERRTTPSFCLPLLTHMACFVRVGVQVKAAELVVTTSFSLKWTLRNPRITSIRDDKVSHAGRQ